MSKRFAELQRIENQECITNDANCAFLYHVQKAILLALKERETLTLIEYRCAEEKLNRQRRDRAKSILENRENL